MAAPPRPNVVQKDGTTIYESLDNIDEQIYNDISTLYQRAAFLDVINKWRNDTAQGDLVPLETGQDVQTLWQRKMNYWCKKRKNKPMLPRPHNIAAPPLPTAPAVPPVAPAITFPFAPPAPLVAPPVAAGSPPNTPSSGERSPPFRADRPHEEPQEPTRGQRTHMFRDSGGPWTFARIIASCRRGDRGTPWKANWLLVRVSETNNIEAQIVAKWVCPPPGAEEEAQDEIDINELLQSANCTHILPWRGHSTRNKRKRILNEDDEVTTEYFMYSDFAPLGTLRNIPKAHDNLTPGPDNKKKHVSEHFIWYVLGELAKGLLAMKTGRCSPSNEPPEQEGPIADSTWVPILHNDLKDINIMIAEGNAKYPTYPRVMLFDFGLSRLQHSDGQHEAVEGTIIWTPPERMFAQNPPEGYIPSTWPCSERSDIWSVGLAAWQLMQATRGVDAFDLYLSQRTNEFGTNAKFFTEGVLTPHDSLFPTALVDAEMPSEYSVELCRFVQSCLRYHPAGRPDVATLVQIAQQRLAVLDRTHRHEFSHTEETILDEFRPE